MRRGSPEGCRSRCWVCCRSTRGIRGWFCRSSRLSRSSSPTGASTPSSPPGTPSPSSLSASSSRRCGGARTSPRCRLVPVRCAPFSSIRTPPCAPRASRPSSPSCATGIPSCAGTLRSSSTWLPSPLATSALPSAWKRPCQPSLKTIGRQRLRVSSPFATACTRCLVSRGWNPRPRRSLPRVPSPRRLPRRRMRRTRTLSRKCTTRVL
mmetsp:Transcript_51566/g.128346  ORF Transcript_51566/g.128346 Transcript_51566/m.128346 type:complete len:208 (+) Transcript_51566:382-1005(+)